MDAEEQFVSVVETLLRDPKITESKMFGTPGLKIGGKYFAMLYKGQLVVKLPTDRVSALVASRDGEFFDPGHGRLMKEWVSVGPKTRAPWLGLAKEARDFVASGAGDASRKKAPGRKKK
jgi:hypothetical protein